MTTFNIGSLWWPTDWGALFGEVRPLIVEIGFGKGHFLRHLAVTEPDASIIGIEIANQCLESAERMIAREHLTNVRIVHAMAESALAHVFTPASVDAFHINFPDPWFKSDHHHRRLMQPHTVELLADRLKIGGKLYLATDIREYAEMVDGLLSSARGLANDLPAPWTDDLPGRVVTKYEATAREAGRPCHYFVYRRTDAIAPSWAPIEELEMPHVVLHLPLSMNVVAEQFQPERIGQGDTHIHFMDVFVGRGGLLFEVHIGEPTITQHVMIALNHYTKSDDPDVYTLHLTTIGQPRATAGVHLVARHLRDWLIGLHSDARVLSQKISERGTPP